MAGMVVFNYQVEVIIKGWIIYEYYIRSKMRQM